MRNVFDQYDQPENKLTHALMTTLSRDRGLIRPFLRRLGVTGTPTFMLGLTEPGSDTVTVATILVGAQPFARFEEAITNLLDEHTVVETLK